MAFKFRALSLSESEYEDLCRRKDCGDREAVDALLHSVGPWAIALSRKITKVADEEAEAAAVAAAFEAIGPWDYRSGSLTNWIMRPVRWAVLAAVKQKKCILSGKLRNDPDQLSANSRRLYDASVLSSMFDSHCWESERPEFDLDLVRIRQREELMRVVSGLPSDLRLIISGRMRGRSIDSLASSLGIRKKEVYVLMTRAIRRVRAGVRHIDWQW